MAAPQDRPKFGPFLALGIFLLLFLAIPSAWKTLIQSTFDEFQAPVWEITSRLTDLTNYWGHQADSKRTLISKNRDLARLRADWELQENLIEKWQQEVTKLNQLHSRVKELENKIGLDQEKPYRAEIARVTHRNLSAWWQELFLRKGTNHQIFPGLGVIYSEGIAGRIHQTGFNSSKVELATNPNFRIVAHFKGDERPVTFQGSGVHLGGLPTGIVLDVPHDITINNGQNLSLETSSLGGTFPGGLPIGLVTALEESGDGLFKTGKVYLSENLSTVAEVTILIPHEDTIQQ